MPLPKPQKNESHDDFMDRCMGDDIMNSEYQDEKQRYAVCETQWKNKESKTMKQLIEVRQYSFGELKIDEPAEEERGRKPLRIKGYAAPFGKMSVNLGGFFETIKPGAFKDSIENKDDVKALINHNPDKILARTTAGTLILSEDENGLFTEIVPPDTTDGRDAVTNLRNGNWNQMSFAFRVLPGGDNWRLNEKEELIREINSAKLYDVSVVTYPAYPDSSVGLRSIGEFEIRSLSEIVEIGRRAVGLDTPLRDECERILKQTEREMQILV